MRAKRPTRPEPKPEADKPPLGPEPSEKVTTGNAFVADHAAPPRRQPAHPCVVGVRAANDMVAAGQKPEAAADWLSRNYPQHFAGPTDARNAMESESARLAPPAVPTPAS